MARSRTRASRRVAVNTQTNKPGYQVVAQEPFYARRRSGAAQDAAALADALGLGQKLYAQIDQNQQAQGAKDAAADYVLGNVDEERRARNKGYGSMLTKLETEAGWIDDEAELDEELNKLDLDNISQEELQGSLTEFFRSRYLNASKDELEVLAPKVHDKITSVLQTVRDRQAELLKTERWGKLSKIFEADASDGDVDWEKFNELSIAVNGTPASTDALFEVVSDFAIRTGRPELLRQPPPKWATGAQSWVQNPAYADKVRAAEAQAMRQLAANEAATERAAKEKQEASLKAGELLIAEQMIKGQDVTAMIELFSNMPGVDPSRVISLAKSNMTFRNDNETRAADVSAMVKLERKLMTGEATLGDVSAAFENGELGGGEAGRKNFSRLVNVAGETMRRDERVDEDRVRSYRSDIGRALTPQKSPTGYTDPADQQRQADAIRDFNKWVYEDGMDPYEAQQKTFEKYKVKDTGGAQFDVTDKVSAIRTKGITGAGLRAAGVTAEDIESLLRRGSDAGGITSAEARAASIALLQDE